MKRAIPAVIMILEGRSVVRFSFQDEERGGEDDTDNVEEGPDGGGYGTVRFHQECLYSGF